MYNNIINEEICKHLNELIDTDILLNIDIDFIYDYKSKIMGNLKTLAIPFIADFNRTKLLSEIKNKKLIITIIDYIIKLASGEFEDYILNQKSLSIKKDILTYYYLCIHDMKKKYYVVMSNIIDTIYKDKIINLSRGQYYSISSVFSLYYEITNEIIKNFVSIRHGIFILIKQKTEINNIIDGSYTE